MRKRGQHYIKVQSHYSVCTAYANFRKRLQISEKKLLINAQPRHSTAGLYKRMGSVP